MYKNEFERIINASKTNALTIFVGAGLSTLSNAPKWSDLIDRISIELGNEPQGKYSSDDYLRYPQIYYNEIGMDDDKYYSLLDECLNTNMLSTNLIHKLIFKLKPNSIITTNFDDFLERAAAEECYSMTVIKSDSDVSSINGNRFIIKAHGDLKSRNIVFKEEDYLNYSESFKLIETILKSIFSTNTVVFIGYGLNDYNIKLILNWSKALLKENFNKPVFIYTDTDKLSDAQITYHESRGLKVIDYHDFINADSEYIDRYKVILESILDYQNNILARKDKIELFDVLYKKLLPLDALSALRTSDIVFKLSPYVFIHGLQVVSHPSYPDILEYFLEIMQMSHEVRNKLDSQTKKRYKIILSVFRKALITSYKSGNKGIVCDDSEICFANENCILFAFSKMNSFVAHASDKLLSNYQKAYACARLNRFNEAYNLFLLTSIDAFKEKNYLIFYLSQINRNNVLKAMKSVNGNIPYVDSFQLNDKEIYKLNFSEFPIDFQNEYASIKDLSDASAFLYKYFYKTVINFKNMEDELDNNSCTLGLSAFQSSIIDMRSYLHFLIGNQLFIDGFSEFKKSIVGIYNYIIRYYVTQHRNAKSGSTVEMFGRNHKFHLNEIDFYCLIEYFSSDDLYDVLNKNDVKSLEFLEYKNIEVAIRNIFDYYDKGLARRSTKFEYNAFELKMKNCLILLRYMDVSQQLVERVCEVILKHNFYCIKQNEILNFLNVQIRCKKMQSLRTKKTIQSAFLRRLDKLIDSINEIKIFSADEVEGLFSLVHFMTIDDNKISCNSIAKRVNQIIELDIRPLCWLTIRHLYEYLSKSQKTKVNRWAKNILIADFDYRVFLEFVDKSKNLDKRCISNLKYYIHSKISQEDVAYKTFPPCDKFEELTQVGYLCFIGILNHEDFSEFLGLNDNFDFYYLYDKFDFSKFNVNFIINVQDFVLKKISENVYVKGNIRLALLNEIKSHKHHCSDEEKLKQYLIEYFC